MVNLLICMSLLNKENKKNVISISPEFWEVLSACAHEFCRHPDTIGSVPKKAKNV